jgi:regulatory protein
MNPHESPVDAPRRSHRTHEPMDRDWLEQQALRYAARWESSAAAVRAHLERKVRERALETGESPDDILGFVPWVIQRLLERNYVDDRRFALTTIDRMRRQGRSTAQIEARLRAKGISESIRQELLKDEVEANDQPELQAAWRLARRRKLGPYCLDSTKRAQHRERHLGVMARQGFDRETAERVVDAENSPEFL